MTGLGACFAEIGSEPDSWNFSKLSSAVSAQWLREALKRTDKQTIRRRRLSNEAVVWTVLGMALIRGQSVEAVVKHLGLAEGAGLRSPTGSPLSSGTVAKARLRVGAEPLEELFRISSEAWSAEFTEDNSWRGLKLFGADGSTLRLADSRENDEVYGRPGSSRSKAAYPQARIVGILGLGSRILHDLIIGSYDQGEQSLAAILWNDLPDHSLTVLDRGFVNYPAFARIRARGTERHFLCRARRKIAARLIRTLGAGDTLVGLEIPANHRKADPLLPRTIIVRMIRCHVKGFRPRVLLTSLLDPEKYPAEEIATLYCRRWEIEIAYGEVKVEVLEREETIRSRHPESVRQEIWGVCVAYNLVRVMMARAARVAGVAANRMSFHNSLVHIRVFLFCAWQTAPGRIPQLYKRLCADLALLVLPERRSRRYARVVKIKMSNYKHKTLK